MSEINLTKEQYDNLPYKTTKITRGKTLGHIIGELEDHGITDYRWTKFKGTDLLEFPLTVERNGVEYPFGVKLTVPKLMYPMKQKGNRSRNAPKTNTYLEKISWRIFYWYLKSRLDAISYGISDVVKEFMYNVHYALPGGEFSKSSVGEALMENIDNLNKLTALEDKRERRMVENE